MPTTVTSAPAVTNFERLKTKLRELFELDKADLDFGIYRVLRQRQTEITEFLDKHLERTVRAALTAHGDVQNLQLKNDLEAAEAAAAGAGIAPELSPRVMELREKLAKGADLEATADEVYSHLLTFFARYYQSGDFLGLHRSTVHGRERYMIPYNGEEVKLIWANMDQYYIKSSELLRDYTFHIRKADLAAGELQLDDLPDESVVRFKLIEGDTEKDNRKPDGKTTRAFVLDETKPFDKEGKMLCVRFRYRELSSERNLQDKLNADTEKTLADSLPPQWKALLFAADPTHQPKDKKDTRTILQRHLRSYTSKYSFDYFIHKDLGSFLRRELDFYIKNEVMHLDDIEEVTEPKAEEYLSKIRAIRRCAMPVIQMIAQLEDFQKKVWLKKKFVVETRYCLTLDRVPEALYPDICTNDAQWQEWNELVGLSQPKPKRTTEFLKGSQHLMLDTRHFTREFTLKLLGSIENLDTALDGVCVHSDNFQACELLMPRYQGKVDVVYNDPPYNTDASAILYKNGYRNSSWCSLIASLHERCSKLLSASGILCAAIDDEQFVELATILKAIFGDENNLGTVAVRSNPSGRITLRGVAQCHDYIILYSKSREGKLTKLPRSEDQLARFDQVDDEGAFEWRNFRRDGSSSTRADRPKQYFPIFVKGTTFRIPQIQWSDSKKAYDLLENPSPAEETLYPIDSSGDERCWRWGLDTAREKLHELAVKTNPQGLTQIYNKYRPNADGILPLTIWTDKKYSATEYGTAVVKSIFGSRSPFDFPKSVFATQDTLHIASVGKSGLALDCFAGSGTTAQALLNMNREDKGTRKYIMIEMGAHFETVLVKRLKKVVYSADWKEGKPQASNTGISHGFKIVRLESYEDALNNLHLRRTPEQEAALSQGGETNRDQYLLGYFLAVESTGSKSLLDLAEFRDPFAYKLNIATSSAGETQETAVDLVETFNWLLGLKVKHIDTAKGFVTVTGEMRAGSRCLILWRTLSANPKADNESLEKFLTKLAVNPADTEFEFIYVNGAHTLNDPHNKVHLIEETFQRLMFDATSFESLS